MKHPVLYRSHYIEIIQPVHIQLPGYQLVNEASGIFVRKNTDARLQLPAVFFIQYLHDQQREGLMINPSYHHILQGMGNRTMPYIVQQDSYFYAQFFFLTDNDALTS